MPLLLRQGRVIDPSNGLDEALDLRIDHHQIVEIGSNLDAAGAEIIDATGFIVAPGFIDIHVHLREPGKEEAETIQTGASAAAAGGFTAVACMPNTTPVNDNISITELIVKRANEVSPVPVHPIAAITLGEEGKELTDFEQLMRAGALAFSDDGRPVYDSFLMRRALERSKTLNVPVIDHCEDPYLFKGGAMNEGEWSQKLGIPGIPAAAEEIMVARNILLAKYTGGHVHLAHLSTQGSMQLVRSAKREGIRVTAEVTPHHFTLTHEAVSAHGTNAKMNPPLRSQNDVDEVLKAIADGTVDVIASDHAPHAAGTKSVEFSNASFGIVGLETSVSLGLDRLVHTQLIGLSRLIELYSLNPAKILGLTRGIYTGAEANLTLLDPNKEITVDSARFQSKSRNTPFHGWKLRGGPALTIVRGHIVWRPSSNS